MSSSSLGAGSSTLTVERAVERFREAVGSRLDAIYEFGSDIARSPGRPTVRMLVLVDGVDRFLLDELSPVLIEAERAGIHVRIDTADNLLAGSDAFPAFSLELQDHRRLLTGEDKLVDLKVERRHLRLHIEHGLRGVHRELVKQYLDRPRSGIPDFRRLARKTLYLIEGALIAGGHAIPQQLTAEALIDGFAGGFELDASTPTWRLFRRIMDNQLNLRDNGLLDAYTCLFEVLPSVIDVVDRMADPDAGT